MWNDDLRTNFLAKREASFGSSHSSALPAQRAAICTVILRMMVRVDGSHVGKG